MKISDIRICGQVMTKTGRIGQVTSAHEDGAVYVRFGSNDYPEPAQASDLEHFAPEACELRVGDKVRVVGKVDSMWGWVDEMSDAIGKIYTVKEALGDRVRLNGIGYQWPTGSIERVSACESCQKLQASVGRWEETADYYHTRLDESQKESREKIAELERSRDSLIKNAAMYCRNAAYWREELDKLQKEALADCKPLDEVAKIYIQISPAVLAQIIAGREE
jgi:hypothetical protein